jgi:hypothetical protein
MVVWRAVTPCGDDRVATQPGKANSETKDGQVRRTEYFYSRTRLKTNPLTC